MADNLFPDDIDELELDETENEVEVIGYKIAPYFDSKTGDFILNGNGQIMTADSVTACTQWCENILATDRYNHWSYTDDIGIDYEAIFSASNREEALTILEIEITEALECDPYKRIQYVQKVNCEWISADEIVVTADVVLLDNELVTIDMTISR